MRRIRIGIALLIVVQIAGIGCQGKSRDQPELGQVTGIVTLDGEPLTNAIIHFMPAGGRESIGLTDKDGGYVLGYLPKIFGAKLGKHRVAIKTYYNDEASPEAMYGAERIPKKYNSETELTAEVKPGNNTFDFDLTMQ